MEITEVHDELDIGRYDHSFRPDLEIFDHFRITKKVFDTPDRLHGTRPYILMNGLPSDIRPMPETSYFLFRDHGYRQKLRGLMESDKAILFTPGSMNFTGMAVDYRTPFGFTLSALYKAGIVITPNSNGLTLTHNERRSTDQMPGGLRDIYEQHFRNLFSGIEGKSHEGMTRRIVDFLLEQRACVEEVAAVKEYTSLAHMLRDFDLADVEDRAREISDTDLDLLMGRTPHKNPIEKLLVTQEIRSIARTLNREYAKGVERRIRRGYVRGPMRVLNFLADEHPHVYEQSRQAMRSAAFDSEYIGLSLDLLFSDKANDRYHFSWMD